jgi:hypothetical protein
VSYGYRAYLGNLRLESGLTVGLALTLTLTLTLTPTLTLTLTLNLTPTLTLTLTLTLIQVGDVFGGEHRALWQALTPTP